MPLLLSNLSRTFCTLQVMAFDDSQVLSSANRFEYLINPFVKSLAYIRNIIGVSTKLSCTLPVIVLYEDALFSMTSRLSVCQATLHPLELIYLHFLRFSVSIGIFCSTVKGFIFDIQVDVALIPKVFLQESNLSILWFTWVTVTLISDTRLWWSGFFYPCSHV